MNKVNPYKLIGTKTPIKITKGTLHRAKVVERKRKVLLQKLDNELPDIHFYPLDPSTYEKKTGWWSQFVNFINQILP